MKLTSLLRGAVVIIDEAHNVEETARESASADLGSAALHEAHALLAGLADIVRQGCSCCHDMGHDSFLAEIELFCGCQAAPRGGGQDRFAADLVSALDTLCSQNCSAVVARWSRGSDSQGAAADAIPGGSDDAGRGAGHLRGRRQLGPGRWRGGGALRRGGVCRRRAHAAEAGRERAARYARRWGRELPAV